MAGKAEADDPTGLRILLFSGVMSTVPLLTYFETVQQQNLTDRGIEFTKAGNLGDENIFANDAFDNVAVFLYKGETAKLLPVVVTGVDEEPAQPIILDRNKQWVMLEKDDPTSYSLVANFVPEPLLPGKDPMLRADSILYLDLAADPDFAEVASVEYDFEDNANIAIMTNADFDHLTITDFSNDLKKKINYIQRYYPRALIEIAPTGDANDDPQASARKKKTT